ncbi:uncharacterized protein [Narcine bancroftii]|uniref:uncharacterized protein n=1 Tax=Narcine bancroftii TaxID=1343680 RepID=UPI003831E9E4
MTVENDIECIKLELAKMQTEWQYKWQQSPTEWNGTSGQPHVECREPTMKERDLDLPCKAAAQAQNLTCQLRRDCAMNDEVDYTCNFLPQFDEGSQTELMPFLNEPADKHCITAVPFCSLPFGSTQFTSLRSFSSFRSGSLLNRFKADLKSNQPLKAYAPRTIFDLKIGLRVKIILPTGKIGTGVLKYIGMLPGVPEVCFGVELQFPENGLRNGTFAGHCYFHCHLPTFRFFSFLRYNYPFYNKEIYWIQEKMLEALNRSGSICREK